MEQWITVLQNPVVWIAGTLAVAAIIIATPRDKDEWYHREAGFGKPYHGEKRSMGCTYTVMFVGLFFAAPLGILGWFFENFVMLAGAGGCLFLFFAMMGLSTEHDRKDAAEDGIKVEYNQNGGVPGMLIMLALVITLAAVVTIGGLTFLIGGWR